ncbi:Gamma-aminobutyrate permease-related permease [Archaeoglobus sulfaticallidus PM70-1]|uniref:Gamma-aminobutyrate permease-related permease n=1 Tax=Archaeoglobus sulfaticallidus PM70-1 TaxID=387631 RepID=N0BIC8_9EURY|nr:amino acid permease [Archaeoglobus sulfaticallidus]AGK60221.1 Gamma-aminobutyrate permease-related permease [Archaeoglobus sulfaticallidus PM70-1]
MDRELVKGLSFKHVWAIGVGAVVGDGIFLLIGEGAKIAGPAALVAYTIAGLFLLFIMISMGEMAVGMPDAGAMWVWNKRTLGGLAGFLTGTSYAIGWIIAGGSVGLAIGTITSWFFQIGSPEISVVIWAIIWLTVFMLLNLVGVIPAANTQLVLVLGLVGLMLLFGIFGFASGKIDPSNYTPFMPNGFSSLFPAIAFGTYAYMGALTLATSGSEVRDPRDLPRALWASSITFLIIYTIAMAAMLGLVPYSELSVSESPFTKAAEVAFGTSAAYIINFAAWLAAATCLLGGTLYAAPRLLYSMGEDRILPSVFSKVHEKHKTPHVAIIFTWIASIGLVLLGYQNPDIVYVHLSLLLVFAWVVTWLISLISAVQYRRKFPEEVKNLPWKQPLYPLFPILGLIGIAIIFYGTFQGAETSVIIGIAYVVLLTIYYFVYGKRVMEE